MLSRGVPKVQEGKRNFASDMVGVKGVNFRVVAKVLKAAPISARHMEAGRDASGDNPGQNMGTKLMDLVALLLGVKQAFVQCMEPWFKTSGFMEAPLSGLWCRT